MNKEEKSRKRPGGAQKSKGNHRDTPIVQHSLVVKAQEKTVKPPIK